MSYDAVYPIPELAQHPFDDPEADLVLKASDGVEFRVYRLLLALSSPFFKSMFTLPQGASHDESCTTPRDHDGRPIVPVSEDSKLTRLLLDFCYPSTDDPELQTLADFTTALKILIKYEMNQEARVRKCLVSSKLIEEDPLRVFVLAMRFDLHEEAKVAARYLLRHPISSWPSISEEKTNGCSLGDTREARHQLLRLELYHRRCGQAASKAAASAVWLTPSNSQMVICYFCGSKDRERVINGTTCRFCPGHVAYLDYISRALVKCPYPAAFMSEFERPAPFGISECANCRLKGHASMRVFVAAYTQEIERRILEVPLELDF